MKQKQKRRIVAMVPQEWISLQHEANDDVADLMKNSADLCARLLLRPRGKKYLQIRDRCNRILKKMNVLLIYYHTKTQTSSKETPNVLTDIWCRKKNEIFRLMGANSHACAEILLQYGSQDNEIRDRCNHITEQMIKLLIHNHIIKRCHFKKNCA